LSIRYCARKYLFNTLNVIPLCIKYIFQISATMIRRRLKPLDVGTDLRTRLNWWWKQKKKFQIWNLRWRTFGEHKWILQSQLNIFFKSNKTCRKFSLSLTNRALCRRIHEKHKWILHFQLFFFIFKTFNQYLVLIM
jgi:hypothetical protein